MKLLLGFDVLQELGFQAEGVYTLHKRSKQKCYRRREDEQSRCNDQEEEVDKMEQVTCKSA